MDGSRVIVGQETLAEPDDLLRQHTGREGE